MEYMEQQMDNLIQSGIDEREWLYSELATLRAENKRLREALEKIACQKNWDLHGWIRFGVTGRIIAKEALK